MVRPRGWVAPWMEGALGYIWVCDQGQGVIECRLVPPRVDIRPPLFLITYPYIAHRMGACSAKGEWSLFSLSLSVSLSVCLSLSLCLSVSLPFSLSLSSLALGGTMVRPRGWDAPWMEGAAAVRNAGALPTYWSESTLSS